MVHVRTGTMVQGTRMGPWDPYPRTRARLIRLTNHVVLHFRSSDRVKKVDPL